MALHPEYRILSLCSGIGGLDLGIDLATGGASRVVCYVEREAYAVGVLVKQMETGALDPAPIWSDLGSFAGGCWRGKVDIVSAGFPCQPFSLAGKGGAEKDERYLWPDIARIICEVRPAYVYLENVPGLINRGLAGVLRDMAELGFAAEWCVYSAAEVGAPHLRQRLFILAAHPDRRELWPEQGGKQPRRPGEVEPEFAGEKRIAPNADSGGRQVIRGGRVFDGERTPHGNETADSDGPRFQRPAITGAKTQGGLSAFGSWAERPMPEPSVRRVDASIPARLDETSEE